MKSSHFKIGLALGGGGARGFAHIGVIKALERHNISIDMIAGTSAGSVAGAFYALYSDSRKLSETAEKLATTMNEFNGKFDSKMFASEKEKKGILRGKLADFIKKGYFLHTELRKTCLNDGIIMRKLFTEIFKDDQFSDTRIPFCCMAADLISGEKIIINKGMLVDALMASCAIPGIFPPVLSHGQLLVDGGIVDNTPVNVLIEMGADFVIASNISRKLKRKTDFKNAVDIFMRSDQITSNELRNLQLNKADFIISPKMNHIDWWNFSKPLQCVAIGEKTTHQAVSKLQKAIRKKATKRRWQRLWVKNLLLLF